MFYYVFFLVSLNRLNKICSLPMLCLYTIHYIYTQHTEQVYVYIIIYNIEIALKRQTKISKFLKRGHSTEIALPRCTSSVVIIAWVIL